MGSAIGMGMGPQQMAMGPMPPVSNHYMCCLEFMHIQGRQITLHAACLPAFQTEIACICVLAASMSSYVQCASSPHFGIDLCSSAKVHLASGKRLVCCLGHGASWYTNGQHEQSTAHANAAAWHGSAACGHGNARYAPLLSAVGQGLLHTPSLQPQAVVNMLLAACHILGSTAVNIAVR